MRRLWLICLTLIIAAGCTSIPVAVTPTLQGPIVPTRNIQPTELTEVSLLPSPTLQEAAAITEAVTPNSASTVASISTVAPATAALVNSVTAAPSATLANTATPEPTIPVDTATGIPSATPSDTATFTPTTAPTSTLTPTDTLTPTLAPSATSLPTDTPAPILSPTEPTLYRTSTSVEPVIIQNTVTLNNPISGTIDDEHPAQLYAFDATANQTIDVSMTAQSRGNLDAYLVLLDPKGREIVRNDNIDNSHTDAAVRDVSLPETGQYIIVATRAGQEFGDTSGDFDLTVSTTGDNETSLGDFTQATGYESLANGTLDDSATQQDYTFRAVAGDVITINLNQQSGDLDPILALTNNLGTTIAWDDDNMQTGSYDSAISNFIIPKSGYYTIIASHYTGSSNSGDYRLKLARTAQNNPGRYAEIDMVNSSTIDDQGTLYTEYAAGDTIEDDKQEHSLQTLLTFHLPPDDGRAIQNATFALEPCRQDGGGFTNLGALTIYRDNYGKLDAGYNLTHPLPGARVLSVQNDCAPLDLTAMVRDAYATGVRDIRLRLVFRSRTDDGKEDQVLFTPGLLITYGQ